MGDEAPPDDRLRLLDELEADLARLYRAGARPGGGAPAGRSPAQRGGRGRPTAAQPPRIGVVRALAPVVTECACRSSRSPT